MFYVMVSVQDSAVGVFGRPMFLRSDGEAVRVFQDEVNRAAEDNMLYRHPDDYSLWRIGTWDDDTGEPIAEHRKRLAEASTLIIKK